MATITFGQPFSQAFAAWPSVLYNNQYAQVSFAPNAWVVQATAASGIFQNWTITMRPPSGGSLGAPSGGNPPTGAVGTVEVRNAAGALMVTLTNFVQAISVADLLSPAAPLLTGDDTLIGSAGADHVDGGSGRDRVDYSAVSAGVAANLMTGQAAGGGGSDTLISIQDITGSAFSDILTGDDLANTLRGGGDDDRIDGGVDDDVIYGDAGNDDLRGGADDDTINAGLGNDSVNGGDGVDLLSFEDAANGVRADLAVSTAQFTGQGTDTIVAIEDLSGGNFSDLLYGTDGANRITGGGSDDRIEARDGADTLDGGAGNDVLLGGGGDDAFHGEGGNDYYDGGTGVDTLSFDTGLAGAPGVAVDLRVTGAQFTGQGLDTILNIENVTGGSGSDILRGNASNNQLSGRAADDLIEGRGGDDTLLGEGGNDVLIGGGGSDTLLGGDGNDILYPYLRSGLDADINATRVFTGLSNTVTAVEAPGDPGFLYILEKDTGIIWRGNIATGAVTQFADIPNSLLSTGGERGALGLAFHPDYAANGRFFVYVTNAAGDIELREFARSPGDPTVATAGSGSTVLTIPHPGQSNHNGGWIAFGQDGYLYVATGDGGGGGDPNNNAQNTNVNLGKILRISVNGDAFPGDATRNYAIPTGNPFYAGAGDANPADDIVFHYGLRNPWRAAFDPRSGNLIIGDVGQDRIEEVNIAAASAAGSNFGWHIMEGTLVYDPEPSPAPQPGDPSLINPVFQYDHSVGRSIAGGDVYLGAALAFQGQYFFADTITNRIFSMGVNGLTVTSAVERTQQIITSIGSLSTIVSFAVDSANNLYAVTLGGSIFRLDPSAPVIDGDNFIEGGTGQDLVSYASANGTGVRVDLANTSAQFTGHGFDTIRDVEFVEGSAFSDILLGSGGANVLWGGAHDDYINGNFGPDILYGENGDDEIFGGAGDDQLHGGAGQDDMTGGAGADRFVYTPSDLGGGAPDRIMDFNFGDGDRIDLTAIDANANLAGDQAFTFVTVFTGAAGEARFSYDAGANITSLQLDWNGDAIADFVIQIAGAAPPEAAIFP